MSEATQRARVARGVAKARARRRRRWLVAGVLAAAVVAIVIVGVSDKSSRSGTPGTRSENQAPVTLRVGSEAPNGTFVTLAGAKESITQLRGTPTLLWFVTTWCSSCQASTQALARNISRLSADGVRVVEVENYADLGQLGPSMSAFARVLAGRAASPASWVFGQASLALTRRYNPAAYLDIYYLLSSSGTIIYVNSSPIDTMGALLAHAKELA